MSGPVPWVVEVAELIDPDTHRPCGLFALCFSAWTPGLRVGARPLCSCGPSWHATPAEAEGCPEARSNARVFR